MNEMGTQRDCAMQNGFNGSHGRELGGSAGCFLTLLAVGYWSMGGYGDNYDVDLRTGLASMTDSHFTMVTSWFMRLVPSGSERADGQFARHGVGIREPFLLLLFLRSSTYV